MTQLPYSSVESSWLRERLARTTWTDRGEIDDLVRLERFIRQGVHNACSGMHYRMLLDLYPEESLILLREYSENRYQVEVQHRREREIAHHDWARAQGEQAAALREDWVRAGGRP